MFSEKHNLLLTLFIMFLVGNECSSQKILLPIEVIGEEGKEVSINLNLSDEQSLQAEHLWLQVNNLGYENKASVKVNSGEWIDLNHDTVEMQRQEKARGGMVHGGFNTIRFSIPIEGLFAGNNRLVFRFNQSDGISNGYRIIRMNLMSSNGVKILPEKTFEEVDPMLWDGPYIDEVSIQKGRELWFNAELWSSYLPMERKGKWYGYDLPRASKIKAKCASCHTRDGRDLEIFSYSNESIVERAKFHRLTEEEGELIASYIRSLSGESPGTGEIGRYGRPWNPPYQPGEVLGERPIEQWAAGAGLEAVLDDDKDMVPYMFPKGISQETVYERFDSNKSFDRTTMPIALQFPDWKHWLPMVHPMDAYTKDDHWNNPLKNNTPKDLWGVPVHHPKQGYLDFREYLRTNPPSRETAEELMKQNSLFHWHYRGFLAQGGVEFNHWRTSDGTSTEKLAEGIPREYAAMSLAKLMAVQYFEIMNEFGLQDKAHWWGAEGDGQGQRQWFGEEYQVFEVPAHFQACVDDNNPGDGLEIPGNCMYFFGQPLETGVFESTNWYHLQQIVNGGEGMVKHNSPSDYNYIPTFILKASYTSGEHEPLRYYHTLNAMYQFRSWSKGNSPNDGRGFRIRVQGPWHMIGRSDSHQLEGFPESVWPRELDKIKPGLSTWVLNAMLRQFLTEVNKPHNDLSIWDREENGGSNSLDRMDKRTSDLLPNMHEFVGLDYWADKMYYLIPEFQEFGVDCNLVEDLIDWCERAWPRIDWYRFRSTGEMEVRMLKNPKESFCRESIGSLTVQVENGGDSPTYEWSLGSSREVISTEPTLDIGHLGEGQVVNCKVTGNSNCLAETQKHVEFTIPKDSFLEVRSNKGDWQPIEQKSAAACAGDVHDFRIEMNIFPKCWLDAKRINDGEQPADGTGIELWKDRSGNGFSAATTNSNLKPVYKSDGFNGLPTVFFGRENADGMRLFGRHADSFLNEDWNILIVGRNESVHDGWANLIGNEKDGSGWKFAISNKGRTMSTFGNLAHHGNTYDFPFSFITSIAKKGNKISIHINDRLMQQFDVQDGTILTSTRELFLGQAQGGNVNATWFHKGPISELMVFDQKLSDDKRRFLEGYLAHKWKMVDCLPLTHPYHGNSPVTGIIEYPNGQRTKFEEEFSLLVDNDIEYGTYRIGKAHCSGNLVPITMVSPIKLAAADDIIGFTFGSGNEIRTFSGTAQDGGKVQLRMLYEAPGGYYWESPKGLEFAKDSPAVFTALKGIDNGVWKLHVKKFGCLTEDLVYEFDLEILESTGDAIPPIPDVSILPAIFDECGIEQPVVPTATDNMSGVVEGKADATFPITKSTIITWKYTDEAGNETSQEQRVIIGDLSPPDPDLETLAEIERDCSFLLVDLPTATDICSGMVVGVPDIDIAKPIEKSMDITWRYTDKAGNSSTQIQKVLIKESNKLSNIEIEGSVLNASYAQTADKVQWIDCKSGKELETGNQIAFAPEADGSFAVRAEWGTCTVTSECIPFEKGGPNDQNDEGDYFVFPNPANESFTLVTPDDSLKLVEILDFSGKTVGQKTMMSPSMVFPLNNYSDGPYLLRITSLKGKKILKLISKRRP